MNKFIKLLCVLSVILAIVFVFSACQKTQEEKLLEMDEAERADELGRLVDESMNAKTSYKLVVNGKMETMLENKRMVETTRTVIAYLKADTEDFVYQEKTESIGTYGSEEMESVSINGYENGYMYIYSEDDGVKTGFKSPVTIDDYKKHMEDLEDEVEATIDKNGCQKITAVKNDDGTWTATYSSFTKENLKLMLKDLGNPEIFIDEDYEISDIVLSFTTDSEFNLKTCNMSFVFEKISNGDNTSQLATDDPFLPVFTADYKVEYGDNLSVAEEVDLSSGRYKNVDDLRYFDIIEKELDEIKSSENASADLVIDQEVSLRGQVNKVNETDNINYKIVDGKVEYDIRANTGDDDYRIVYKDGEQEVFDEDGNSDGAEKQSNLEAMVFLESLIDQAGYDIDIIRNMEKSSDGEYKFTLKPDITAYEEIADTYNGNISASTAYLTIKMKDGKIASYIYELTVKIYIPVVSSTMVITQENECTYEY